MAIAYIGLGANLGDALNTLKAAIKQLAEQEGVRLLGHSSFYRSKPHGPADQPDYINAVAQIDTDLAPQQLLDRLFYIENHHGRERKIRWGARTLDLDLLLYDQELIETESLTVPHPRIAERSFVVWPLLELNPELSLPTGLSLKSCQQQLSGDDLVILEAVNSANDCTRQV